MIHSIKDASRSGRGGLRCALALALFAIVPLAGCTVALEPAFDERIVAELEELSTGTTELFAAPPPRFPLTGYPDRVEKYAALAAKAELVRLLAESRPEPSGRVANFFRGLTAPSEPDPDGEEDRYAQATVGYMEDYRRNLDRLAERDREKFEELSEEAASFEAEERGHLQAVQSYADAYADWLRGAGPRPEPLRARPEAPEAALSENFVDRRYELLKDILRDALVYEREILDRSR